MKTQKKRRALPIFAASLAVCLLSLAVVISFSQLVSFAAEATAGETYSVPVDLSDLAMGKDNFTETATVEKQDDKYYFTFGFSSKIGYVDLSLKGGDPGKEIGITTEKRDGWTYHTYTLNEANLKGGFRVAAYINAMKAEMSFDISLKWDLRTKTSDEIRDIGERPAEFIPTITTKAAAGYSLKVGTVFPIPEATATIGNESCMLEMTVTRNGEAVEIKDGRFILESAGTYKLVYKATSDKYKTSLGNDTFTEYVVEVMATTDGIQVVKFEDESGILPKDTGILAGRADKSSSEYKKAASAMKKISDNYEVFSVELVDGDGEEVTPGGNIKLMFRADDYFDRAKVKVYYMNENGGIAELSVRGYGRYVITETDKTGVFIVGVPGVAFVMPMWGYALIFGGVAALIAAAVTISVIAARKKKKRVNAE